MESVNSLVSSSHSVPYLSFKPISSSPRRRTSRVTASRSREADNGRNYASGKLVDESMIILRKRIHEMKMTETTHSPPAHWMDWEKRCYANYDSDICEALGYLQSHLMNTRPSVALGMLALITLSVPLSSAVVLFRLIEIAGGVWAAASHLC